MLHDVIMPALGMAQDSGLIVAWNKKPGDRVHAGDVLFEVETDKATAEVEADVGGFLCDVRAGAGEAVPVGHVIALIADTVEETEANVSRLGPSESPEIQPVDNGSFTSSDGEGALPDGYEVIMPALGMAQDSGVLVSWQKEPGEPVSEDDVLFEVETDKTTVEVNAGKGGFLAAVLAKAGESVPTGAVIAIISRKKPDEIITRSFSNEADAKVKVSEEPAGKASANGKVTPTITRENLRPRNSGSTGALSMGKRRVLASPKARRLALERGISLEKLRAQGVSEPIHAQDVENYADLSSDAEAILNLSVDATRYYAFLKSSLAGGREIEPDYLLASFAAFSLEERNTTIGVTSNNRRTCYQQISTGVSELQICDEKTPATLEIVKNEVGEDFGSPTLSLIARGETLDVYLTYQPGVFCHARARRLISNFAGRLAEPLRHLL